MTNIEKVIKGLEICYYSPSKCENCPYHNLPDGQSCTNQLLRDALTMLKEHEAREQCLKTKCVICPHCANCDVDENGLLKSQEAMKPIYSEEKFGDHLPHCPVCKGILPNISQYGRSNFCHNCGKKMKWNA